MIGLYRVLLIPAQDYARHPHITRHHHIFENFDDRFKITVLNVRLRKGRKTRVTRHRIVEVGFATGDILRSYVLGYIRFHLELARLIKSERYDCVLLSNIISPLIPLLISGRPIVFDYKDAYALSASVPFKTPLRQVVYCVSILFERIIFGFHMTVVVPSPSMQVLVRERFGINSRIITNGVNTELFHPIPKDMRDHVRSELGVRPGEFCLCYLGSIENWIGLEAVVEALVRLKSLRFIMIGGPPRSGRYLRYIMGLCEKRGVRDRVTWTGFKNQREAAPIVSACDATIVPFPLNRELSAVALPDKVFEYLASGTPVISTKLPDVQKLFGDLVHFYSSSDELIEVLRRLQSNMNDEKRDLSEQIARARTYDWKNISKSYENLISELVQSNLKRQQQ